MQMKTGILIGVALLLAFATFFLAKVWLDSQREGYRRAATTTKKQKPIPSAEVLVAKINMPAGVRVKREHLEWRAWPKKGVMKTHFVKGDKKIADILGFIVRRGLLAGEPLVKGRVVEQGDRGYMAALLDPGMQAVSIKVRRTSSVSGFIKPGDLVDVLLTMSIRKGGGGRRRRGSSHQVTETILKQIHVIAIDTVTNDQNTKPSAGKTITLQVTPKQAQLFTVSKGAGGLSLVLRSLARQPYVATEETDAKGEKGDKSGKKVAETGKGVKVANGESPEDTTLEESMDESDGTLRTWSGELSALLPQVGGRKKVTNTKIIEVVRGTRSRSVNILDKTDQNAKTKGVIDYAKKITTQASNFANKTATGFGAAASALK